MKMRLRFLSTLLVLALGGCVAVRSEKIAPVAPSASTESSAAPASILDRLYFGRTIPGGGEVSDAQWAAFLAEVVTPRFPAGLTAWHADGQWRNATGTITREPCTVLELIHPDDGALDRAVAEIIAEYRRRFGQESVLRVRARVDAQFQG